MEKVRQTVTHGSIAMVDSENDASQEGTYLVGDDFWPAEVVPFCSRRVKEGLRVG